MIDEWLDRNGWEHTKSRMYPEVVPVVAVVENAWPP
jgi:hypothetical protein